MSRGGGGGGNSLTRSPTAFAFTTNMDPENGRLRALQGRGGGRRRWRGGHFHNTPRRRRGGEGQRGGGRPENVGPGAAAYVTASHAPLPWVRTDNWVSVGRSRDVTAFPIALPRIYITINLLLPPCSSRFTLPPLSFLLLLCSCSFSTFTVAIF